MQRIFLTAIVAGIVAGLAGFGLQSAKLTPLILHAETYESVDEGGHEHDHGGEAWTPADGFERSAWSAVANIGVGVGYALLLVGAFALRGEKMDATRGLLWGLAGFAVFSLAPGFGLSPELPGSMAADLFARQTWWIGTAAATAGGLWLLAFYRPVALKAAGIALLALPHVIGAPHPEAIGGAPPTELSAEFAAASLAVAAVFWAVLGTVGGWFYSRKS